MAHVCVSVCDSWADLYIALPCHCSHNIVLNLAILDLTSNITFKNIRIFYSKNKLYNQSNNTHLVSQIFIILSYKFIQLDIVYNKYNNIVFFL